MADVWSGGCCTCSSSSGYIALNCAVHRTAHVAVTRPLAEVPPEERAKFLFGSSVFPTLPEEDVD